MRNPINKFALVLAITAVVACSGERPRAASMHDEYAACVAPDGQSYMVEVEDGSCRPGDNAKRCALPEGAVVYVRAATAEADCARRGGRLLGRATPPSESPK